MHRFSLARRFNGHEVGSIVGISAALVLGAQRIGVNRSGEADGRRSIQRKPQVKGLQPIRARHMGADHLVRRVALFDPRLQVGQIIDREWTRAAAAMIHAGNHKHTEKFLRRPAAAHGFFGGLVVVDRVHRRVGLISPSLVQDHPAAGRFEFAQIRVVGSTKYRVCGFHALVITIEVKVSVLPARARSRPEAYVTKIFLGPIIFTLAADVSIHFSVDPIEFGPRHGATVVDLLFVGPA